MAISVSGSDNPASSFDYRNGSDIDSDNYTARRDAMYGLATASRSPFGEHPGNAVADWSRRVDQGIDLAVAGLPEEGLKPVYGRTRPCGVCSMIRPVSRLAAPSSLGVEMRQGVAFDPDAAQRRWDLGEGLVVRGEVIASIARKAAADDWRASMAFGVELSAYEPRPEEVELAIAATEATGLDVAGTDVIRTDNGLAILEVNPAPAIVAFEEASGVDIAGKLGALLCRGRASANRA